MERKDDEFKSLYPQVNYFSSVNGFCTHISNFQVYFGESGLVSTSWLETPDAPLFLPPAAFSRMDLAQEYQYRFAHHSKMTQLKCALSVTGGKLLPLLLQRLTI